MGSITSENSRSKLKLSADASVATYVANSMVQNSSPKGSSIRLLTFNTWGLKYVSKFRKERLQAIADRLGSCSNSLEEKQYDIVALQEIWSSEDWDYIDKICAEKYPFRRWFSSGIIAGPGLAVLSKFPIEKTFLYRFPINGRPSAFFRGDWYVGKSLSITILQVGGGSTLALLNSHMHAPYSITGDAAYECHRACQAWDIAMLVNELKQAGHAVVLVGDLNSRPKSLQYRIFEKEAELSDSWEILNGATDLELLKKMSPWDQIKNAATTCDSILNTWRANRSPEEACRLDYALIDKSQLKPLEASVEFTDKIPGIGSYSDHFAYAVTVQFVSEPKVDINVNEKLQVYMDMKALVLTYMSSTLKWQRNWRLWHFGVSLVVAVAFLPVIIIVSYKAPWSSVLFYLTGCLLLATGVVNGLISVLFGRYEQRNMNEVLCEVDDRARFIRLTQTSK